MIIRRGLRWLRRRLSALLIDQTAIQLAQNRPPEPHTPPANPANPSGLTASWSLQTLLARRPEPDAARRIAFVSALPPEDTGIANCSLRTWLGHRGPVDLFCPAPDLDWFFANRHDLRGPDGAAPLELFDVELLLTAARINRYSAIVIAFGNSDHHKYLIPVLARLEAADLLDRCSLYIHDPCMLNILNIFCGRHRPEYIATLGKTYRRDIPALLAAAAARGESNEHRALAAHSILGARYFHQRGIRHFLVNSEAARTMIQADLAAADAPCDAVVSRVFHPVFPAPGAVVRFPSAMPTLRRPITIGTFGIPSRGKCTDDVIAAIRLLRADGHSIRLVIAGYHANVYAAENASLLAGLDIDLIDAPSDWQLLEAMRNVDLAVQLRAHNFGESSGVVPQLLSVGRAVIVNRLGSFAEYGDAVAQIPPGASPHIIARAILATIEQPPSPAAIRRYAETHSPARFRDALIAALDEAPRARLDQPGPAALRPTPPQAFEPAKSLAARLGS